MNVVLADGPEAGSGHRVLVIARVACALNANWPDESGRRRACP